MTATLDRPARSGRLPSGPPGEPRLPLIPGRRRSLSVLLSAILIFGSIAAFAGLYVSAGHRQAVLIVTRTIEQGQPIVAADLGQANAAISGGVEPILVEDGSELAGRRAAVTIPAGSLLTLGDTTTRQSIAPANAVVGMALKPGQLPSTGLRSGDQVMVVQTGAPGTPLGSPSSSDTAGSASSSTGVLVPLAAVFDVQAPSGNQSGPSGTSSGGDTSFVSVELSREVAAEVSSAAAAGEISLVLLPMGTEAKGGADGSSGGNHGKQSNGSGAS